MSLPMNIPMHRFKYTKLTKSQIGEKLRAAESGPVCRSEFTSELSGKSIRIITDNGPDFSYSFSDKKNLFVKMDGNSFTGCYGALTLKNMIFFSHMIPDEQRGYNVFIEQDTGLVTIIEVWLSSGRKEVTMGGKEILIDDREVQRHIYFGYVEKKGQAAPESRHHLTNRIEGKGMYWKQDTGIETLELYASVVSTNFVELTRHADDLGYCSPSDYVLVNDNTFIYNRTECEFSGIFTAYVVDLFSGIQVGVRLGFNENDELEYYMFRGKGEIVGELTPLAPFDKDGSQPMFAQAPGAPARPQVKGQRMAYRPVRDFPYISDEEVHNAALKSTTAFVEEEEDAAQTMYANNLPFSDILVGKEFILRYDRGGPVRHYKVTEKFKLKYREDRESTWHEVDYRAYEANEGLAWFSHLLVDSNPRASVQIALDLTNGLTTCIHSMMGTKYYGNETSYYAIFGVAEMEGINPPKYIRHELSDDLVGHAWSWTYSGNMTSMHLYTTPHSHSWTIYTADQTLGAQWCAPCLFVKVRDGIYIMAVNEEACNGHEMIVMINEKIRHDCGFGFHGNEEGVRLSLTGAIGRHIGCYDIKKYFGPNAKRKGI
ncbi:MAG: MoaF N-terminal domain-containing protein [Prolixibacteraceae bacterium]|nr:MoaF N-terminal domain-containing protein [Prolixibacteraceae bacterium]